MHNLSIIQKAACAALFRALSERGEDRTGRFLTPRTPRDEAELAIADYVSNIPLDLLPKFILPEMTQHGNLPGGYSSRWSAGEMARKKKDAELSAYNNQRMSENTWPLNSDSSSSVSRDNSSSAASDGHGRNKYDRANSTDTIKPAERKSP